MILRYFAAFAVVISTLLLYQNCGNIHLSSVNNNSVQCIPQNLKIDQDPPGGVSTRFFVSDQDDNQIEQDFNWSIEGVSQTQTGPDFLLQTMSLVDCQTYKIHAQYRDCSEDKNIQFDYTQPGQACLPPTQPPQTVGCSDTITTPTGTTRAWLKRAGVVQYGVWPCSIFPNWDITEWDNLWGHYCNPEIAPWPGSSGAPPMIKMKRNQFLGIHFKTSDTAQGNFVNPTMNGGPSVIMAISHACGDFTEHLDNNTKCVANGQEYGFFGPWTGIPTSDSNLVSWSVNKPYDGTCKLQPNTDYYLNIMFADPNLDGTGYAECAQNAPTCNLTIVSFSGH